MQFLAIVVLSMLATIFYAIVHDQITARVCIEYFTIGHPKILAVKAISPTVIGFVWGVAATWWAGLGLGIPLAIAARIGSRPKKSVREFVFPMLVVMGVTGALALGAGIAGYVVASMGWITLQGPLAAGVPPQQHVPFIADLFAHNMSYAAGAIGGIVLVVRTWHSRLYHAQTSR
jgi:hypothetical protein